MFNKKSKLLIAIILVALVSSLLLIFTTQINKPYKIVTLNNDTDTFISGNYNLKFNYPNEFELTQVTFPSIFENESLEFSNGLAISYFRFEGFFGPYESTENIVTKDGKSCSLNIIRQGFQNEYFSIFGQCPESPNSLKTVTFIWQEVSLNENEANNYKDIVKSIIESMEFNSGLKII